MTLMIDATPYTVPQEPGRWPAIVLAVLVHAALFAFLWIGVNWQSETPATIEAEVWSPELREAAPLPQPVKQPEPIKEPEPVIKETPRPVVEEPPVRKPDIALEQEKKRKAELEKKRLEQEKQAKLKQKAEEERLAKLKEEQRIAKEKADKKKAEEAKRKQQEAEDRNLAKMHEEEMQRLANSGATGTGGTGDAPKAQGPRGDASYIQALQSKIRSNTRFLPPPDLVGNPAVEYTVELLPDGSVRGIRKLKSSGIPSFDEAVERAIQRSTPYPIDKSTGKVPSSFTFKHSPKDN